MHRIQIEVFLAFQLQFCLVLRLKQEDTPQSAYAPSLAYKVSLPQTKVKTIPDLFHLAQITSDSQLISFFSTAEGTQKWLINFGQHLENLPIDFHSLRSLIGSTPQTYISMTKNEIINLLALSIAFQPASKISNIIYYICRRSQAFRKQLISYLSKECQLLWKNSKIWNNYTEKKWIVLTDMFLFGIHFTQTQLINEILSPIFLQQQQTELFHEMQFKKCISQLHYIHHYVSILTHPSILLQKNRLKLLIFVRQFIAQKCYKILYHFSQLSKNILAKLQLFYSAFPYQNTNMSTNNCQTQKQTYEIDKKKQIEAQYLDTVHEYQNFKHHILCTINKIINSLKEIFQDFSQFEDIYKKIQKEFPSKFEENLQQDKNAENKREKNQQQISSQQKESFTDDDLKETEDVYSEKNQQRLLTSIYNKCKFFQNHIYLQHDPIYTIPPPCVIPKTSFLQQPIVFLEILPQTFLENLRNILDYESATLMSTNFLQQYNKHCNRAKLVKTIFKDLHDRNNIIYIVRVLYDVRAVQKSQIDQLIKEQLEIIKQKSKGRINKGIYGKYASIFVQLIKFKFFTAEFYLGGLLQLIRKFSQFTFEQELDIQCDSPCLQSNDKNLQAISLPSLINLLQKCGLEIYYYSLDSHIIFNEIISCIYNHIRKKSISYDVQIVNRFNGLVSFLQNIKKAEKIQQQILSISEIGNEKKLKNKAKILQKELKNDSSACQSICNILQNSISSQNYIETYLYAELIYEINSVKLDNAIKQITYNKIKNGLDIGNYQNAAVWARFLGESHRSQIVKQNQIFNFLLQSVMNQYFDRLPCAAIKIICSTLQASSSYMKKTKKITEFNQILKFLLFLKNNLLKAKGLTNTILQQQIQDILQDFHSAFRWIRTVQECIYLLGLAEKRNCDVEKLLSNFQKECKQKQDKIDKPNKQLKQQVNQDERKNLQFVEKQSKYQEKKKYAQKQQKYSSKYAVNIQIWGQQSLQNLQISSLQTTSSRMEKQRRPGQGQKVEKTSLPNLETCEKPKKMKVVGRLKTSNKIQKIQVAI